MDMEKLLNDFKTGKVPLETALEHLKNLPFEDLDFALVDHHRQLRQGFPEVIYCPGKSLDQIKEISAAILRHEAVLLATRAEQEVYDLLKLNFPQVKYNAMGKIVYTDAPNFYHEFDDQLIIVSAGTSDLPVAEEAFQTALAFGYRPRKITDVGVAGIHRLLKHQPEIDQAKVIIVVAGMEGALASVVGGLVSVPLIAVPTSTGYGASFSGLAALLAMLNSCASGITVCNIDNGFGAAFAACKILNLIQKNKKSTEYQK
jgi:NCAIR mutase (PurE)-related protein